MLAPDISSRLGYCFDISLLSMVSNADTDESELVLCSCMISLFIYHYSSTFFNEVFLYMH